MCALKVVKGDGGGIRKTMGTLACNVAKHGTRVSSASTQRRTGSAAPYLACNVSKTVYTKAGSPYIVPYITACTTLLLVQHMHASGSTVPSTLVPCIGY